MNTHLRASPRSRWDKTRLAVAVSAAVAAPVAAQNGVHAQEETPPNIETLVVTATKRSQSVQDVAIPVQAMSGDGLRELGVDTFDEYVDFLPNVATAGNGPGKKEIYLRGSATEQSGVTVTPQQGSAPGVALYLDEQPVSFGGRNLDVYAADLERIEVLAGPQGTLFGASSQSGNLRLITRKPDPTGFSAGFNARFATTRGGAASASADAFVNIPFGAFSALRLVAYSDHPGGWVDNAAATLNAIKSGKLNLAGMRPDGAINEVDTILKATVEWTPGTTSCYSPPFPRATGRRR